MSENTLGMDEWGRQPTFTDEVVPYSRKDQERDLRWLEGLPTTSAPVVYCLDGVASSWGESDDDVPPEPKRPRRAGTPRNPFAPKAGFGRGGRRL